MVDTQRAQTGTLTVLVADDEEGIRGLVREILEEHSYQVLEARDGQEALDQVNSTDVHLVIMDLAMPGKEGMETIRTLHIERPDLKILAISGAFGGSILKCATILGAHAALKKPFSYESLVESVESLLA